ncbi:MAG: M17 family peptidase N-terminal domain-containing protein, partial [Patescibacteria group bacterium]
QSIKAVRGKNSEDVIFAGSEDARGVDGSKEFDGEQGDILLLHSHGNIPAKWVAIVGLGKTSELTVSDLQTIAAKIGKKAKEVAAKTVAIALPKELQAQAIVEGLTLGTYTFSKHKSEETRNKEKHIEEVSILTTPPKLNAVVAGISRGETVSQAVMFARDLVNEPPSFTTPTHLADVAGKLVKGHANMSCEVFGPKEMKTLGMEAILGIARGSDEEPRFIHLSYKGGGGKTVCLVGKGITFDTGGLSLKDSKNMETMKLDMAGAAAILGVFSVLPILKPNINVVGLIAATENMPGPKAIKPGDVVAAMNGKTIEILNTDAEGRVVLADALSYAGAKVKSDAIVDLATLTGACMVALGEEIAGMFTDDVTLAEELER